MKSDKSDFQANFYLRDPYSNGMEENRQAFKDRASYINSYSGDLARRRITRKTPKTALQGDMESWRVGSSYLL